MPKGLTSPQVEVNNLSVKIMPNSFSYTEGKGEQTIKTQSAGGASVETVFFSNVESNFTVIKFELYNTDKNIELALIWKNNLDENVVSVTGGSKSATERVTQGCALVNDYEVNLKNEGVLSLEFHGAPAA